MENNLQIWVKHIHERELPIFKHTITAINRLTQSDDSSPSELTQAILQDTTLTARILRVANSSLCNRTNTGINTISRAVVLIGFHRVRDLCFALNLFDSLLQNKTHYHLLNLMAQSFHAAVQARAIAEKRGENSPEEYFIAALLYHLGEMAFWSISGNSGDKILAELNEIEKKPEQAQRQLLGTTFSEITQLLLKDWDLCTLLRTCLVKPNTDNPSIKSILLAHKLAEVSHNGWDTPDSATAISDLSECLGLPKRETEAFIHDNAEKAREVANCFGAEKAALLIPNADIKRISEDSAEDTDNYPTADPILQLTSLRKISYLLEQHADMYQLLQAILEGLHIGVGLDRAIFAVFNRDKDKLRAKFAAGYDKDTLLNNFEFTDNNFINMIIKNEKALWIESDKAVSPIGFISPKAKKILGNNGFFLYTLCINKKPLGVFYADRQPSKRKLDESIYEDFKHFCKQAYLVFKHLELKKISH